MQYVNELESIYISISIIHYSPPTPEILHNRESIFIF